jgi:membrane glycosyltransferase
LIRRRGWAICMAPALSGSYEETPPSLTEHATRDRRWCQGNLQHVGVLPARGLHWISRLHLMMGIGSYVTAPMWLIFLLLGVLLSLQAQFIRPDYFPSGFTLFPKWPTQDPVRAAWVFVGTMALLIAPKLLGLIAVLLRPSQCKHYGGALRLFFGVLIETLISGLIAPVMMWKQTIAVLQVLSGADAGWNAQRRDERSAPLRANIRAYIFPTIGGILLAAAAYAVSLPLLFWMSPVILGLLLAIPLAASTSSAWLGEAARRLGLMVIPEERDPPEVVARADALGAQQGSDGAASLSQQLTQHPELWAAHAEMLPARHQPRGGQIDVDLVIGLAKLEDCDSFEDALCLLTRSEKNALLASATGFAKFRSVWERSRAEA